MSKLVLLLVFLFAVSCEPQDPSLYSYKRPIMQVENFNFTPNELWGNNQVDILWVVDNSGSMYDEQTELQNNFSSFINKFKTLKQADWKMGLLSSDNSELPYLGFGTDLFNHTEPNPEKRFTDAVGMLGTSGSATEKYFDPIKKNFTQYKDFVRKKAYLAIIFLTDEPEQSIQSSKDFNNYLLGLKSGDRDLIELYGGFTAKDLPICPPETWGGWTYSGSKFEESINFFGGSFFDLCHPDMGKKLAAIGEKIAGKIGYPKILLDVEKVPFLCTLKVFYKDEELPPGKKHNGGKWFFDEDNNSVVFYDLDFVQSDKDQITVDYIVDDGHFSPDDACMGQDQKN